MAGPPPTTSESPRPPRPGTTPRPRRARRPGCDRCRHDDRPAPPRRQPITRHIHRNGIGNRRGRYRRNTHLTPIGTAAPRLLQFPNSAANRAAGLRLRAKHFRRALHNARLLQIAKTLPNAGQNIPITRRHNHPIRDAPKLLINLKRRRFFALAGERIMPRGAGSRSRNGGERD